MVLFSRILNADHDGLRDSIRVLQANGKSYTNYYLAQSFYYCGQFDEAEKHCADFINSNPLYPEAIYLQADILREKKKFADAWLMLEDFIDKSARLKTWMYLANFVHNEDDLNRFNALLLRHKNIDRKVFRYQSNATLRAKKYQEALMLWRERYREFKQLDEDTLIKSAWKLTLKKLKQEFPIAYAGTALHDLNCCFFKSQIEFFVISGTLLGMVRENAFLPHDYDIDIGVFDSVSIDKMLQVIREAGQFKVLPVRSQNLIKIRHANGILIDIFIHQELNDEYLHEGVKMRWSNNKFELIPFGFIGGTYLIPKNYDLYLTENYGEWRKPKANFDCALDTPNGKVFNDIEMIVYAYSKVIFEKSKQGRFLTILRNYGEMV